MTQLSYCLGVDHQFMHRNHLSTCGSRQQSGAAKQWSNLTDSKRKGRTLRRATLTVRHCSPMTSRTVTRLHLLSPSDSAVATLEPGWRMLKFLLSSRLGSYKRHALSSGLVEGPLRKGKGWLVRLTPLLVCLSSANTIAMLELLDTAEKQEI